MRLLKKLNRQPLIVIDGVSELMDKFVQQIIREQETRTVSRKKAQVAKAMKKGKA